MPLSDPVSERKSSQLGVPKLLWGLSIYLPHRGCIHKDCRAHLGFRLSERLGSEKWSQKEGKPEIKVLRYGYDGFFDQVRISLHICERLFWSCVSASQFSTRIVMQVHLCNEV